MRRAGWPRMWSRPDLADKCTIQLAYADRGGWEPVSLLVKTHGTGRLKDAELQGRLTGAGLADPRAIRKSLQLNQPIFVPTSAYGHFGREAGEAGPGSFSWETLDLAKKLA